MIVARRAGTTALSLGLTLAVVALAVLAMGANPAIAAAAVWQGIIGSPFTIGQTLTTTGVLVLTGLAVAIPFTARLFNVGGEGQLTVGAVGAVTTALTLGRVPGGTVLALLAAVAFGVAWALIPGLLRALLGASEMIVSLLLNFVAALAAAYVISRVFPDTSGQATRLVDASLRLPVLWRAGAVNIGLLIAVAVVAALWLIMSSTRLGFAVRAVGLNPRAATLAGFSERTSTIATFAIAGGAAGLAGGLLVLGSSGQLNQGLSAGYGFLGVVVALLAGSRTGLIPVSALAIAALTVGSNRLQLAAGLPFSLGIVVIGVLVLALLATGVIAVRRS